MASEQYRAFLSVSSNLILTGRFHMKHSKRPKIDYLRPEKALGRAHAPSLGHMPTSTMSPIHTSGGGDLRPGTVSQLR